MTTHVFTSAAINYLPKVKVLFKSLKKTHPEWVLHLWLIEEKKIILFPDADSIHTIEDLNISNWRSWAFGHTLVELATAVKPFILKKLLSGQNVTNVLYFDPDTVVFSRLDEIIEELNHSSIVLTPHLTIPEQEIKKIVDNEICSLQHGVYNLGFFGVSSSEIGHSFADWWCKRLYYFCMDNIPEGLFTDQRWIDLVPAMFDRVKILRSCRFNVASWNLSFREISVNDKGEFLINGQVLGFYHFTGFDSGNHIISANSNSNNNQFVLKLLDWYAEQISFFDKFSGEEENSWSLGFFSDGSSITNEQRRLYRNCFEFKKTFSDPYNSFNGWWDKYGHAEEISYLKRININLPILPENLEYFKKTLFNFKKEYIDKKIFLFILHEPVGFSGKGGVERCVHKMCDFLIKHNHFCIIYDAKTGSIVSTFKGNKFNLNASVKVIQETLYDLVDFLHVHHTLGWSFDDLKLILKTKPKKKIFSIHDFYALCKNFDKKIACKDACDSCKSHRNNHLDFLSNFDEIWFPSENTKNYFDEISPNLKIEKIVIQHDLSYIPKNAEKVEKEKTEKEKEKTEKEKEKNIFFIGCHSTIKGLNIAEEFYYLCNDKYKIKFIGESKYTSIDTYKFNNVFDLKNLIGNTSGYSCFPSIVPETFCFAFYETLLLNNNLIPIVGTYGNPADVCTKNNIGVAMEDCSVLSLINAIEKAEKNRKMYLKNIKKFVEEINVSNFDKIKERYGI